jgi:transcriptional regulator with XRE-family HTH domain
MAGTPETPIPVRESYRALLRAGVEAVGGQHRAAALSGVSQGTVSRTLTAEYPATYTTLRKLADALPGVPDPVVAVRDADHERWCKIGAALAELKPDDFRVILSAATRLLDSGAPSPTDAQVDAVRDAIAKSEPKRLARRRSRR